jgi:hypothetical protein
MAYMAQLDNNNTVIRVLSVSNNDCPDPAPTNETQGSAFLEALGLGSNWKQTSFNSTFRKNYAGIGYTWRPDLDGFVAPQPFASWQLNETTCQWEPPTPYPTDGETYRWDEDTTTWVAVN